MVKRTSGVRVIATAIATTMAFSISANTWADPESKQIAAETTEASTQVAEDTSLTLADLEAQLKAYYQYHAEEELLDCLRDAKSDPTIRGTHLVGPRLKYLKVKHERYADFRDDTADLSSDDKRQVEVRIIELHMAQNEHIEHARGLFENGRTTTDKALIEYHDTGCIRGLEKIVEDIRNERQGATEPAAS